MGQTNLSQYFEPIKASEMFGNESNRDTYIGHYSINFAQIDSDITLKNVGLKRGIRLGYTKIRSSWNLATTEHSSLFGDQINDISIMISQCEHQSLRYHP